MSRPTMITYLGADGHTYVLRYSARLFGGTATAILHWLKNAELMFDGDDAEALMNRVEHAETLRDWGREP